MTRLTLSALLVTGLASPALAHTGPHLHPHDGAHWLTIVAALGLITVAGGLALARARSDASSEPRGRPRGRE